MISRIRAAYRALAAPVTQWQTRIRAGGRGHQYFWERDEERNLENLRKWKTIYKKGGLVAEAIDVYPLFMLARGYTLVSDDEGARQHVQEILDQSRATTVWRNTIVDALVTGDGFNEALKGRGQLSGAVTRFKSVPAETMVCDADDFGNITGYRQKFSVLGAERESAQTIDPADILHLRFFSTSDSPYGISLVQRAFDEIARDTKTAEGIAAAIERHGFPRYQIKVGSPEHPNVSDQELAQVEREFEDMNAKNEFTTTYQVQIENIDQNGAAHILEYNDATLMRLCAALGVPEELLGLRRGSTDATSVGRMEAFFLRISTMQQALAEVYNTELIDRITGRPGLVKLVFEDVSPKDENQRAEYIERLGRAFPMEGPFAVMSRKQIQAYLGIDPDEYEQDAAGEAPEESEEAPDMAGEETT